MAQLLYLRLWHHASTNANSFRIIMLSVLRGIIKANAFDVPLWGFIGSKVKGKTEALDLKLVDVRKFEWTVFKK